MIHTFGFISFNDKTGGAEFGRTGIATFLFACFDDSVLMISQSSFEFPMQWETDSMKLETTVQGSMSSLCAVGEVYNEYREP